MLVCAKLFIFVIFRPPELGLESCFKLAEKRPCGERIMREKHSNIKTTKAFKNISIIPNKATGAWKFVVFSRMHGCGSRYS